MGDAPLSSPFTVDPQLERAPDRPIAPIETARLILRGFTPADASDVFAYSADEAVARCTTWHPHRTLADAEAFIAMVLARGPREHTWAILLKPDSPKAPSAVIGAIEFGLKPNGTEAQIDYCLARPHWNRGLMTEAARAVIAWGVRIYPAVGRVVSQAMTENVGSRRVMEKCGMTFEGTRRVRWSKRAEEVELSCYTMMRTNANELSNG